MKSSIQDPVVRLKRFFRRFRSSRSCSDDDQYEAEMLKRLRELLNTSELTPREMHAQTGNPSGNEHNNKNGDRSRTA